MEVEIDGKIGRMAQFGCQRAAISVSRSRGTRHL